MSKEKDKDLRPGASSAPTSTVEISISCRNLINKDVLSKSDPMVVVFHRPTGSDHWVELIRTETVENDLDPDFAEKALIEYYFEERQLMRFEVYDVDKPSEDLADHEFMGETECTLAMIVSSGPQGFTANLTMEMETVESPKSGSSTGKGEAKKELRGVGEMILTAEELASLKDEAQMKFMGNSMGAPFCCIFPPKIFYLIYRMKPSNGEWCVVYRSDYAEGVNPAWPAMSIPMRKLCNGERDANLKIECFTKGTSPSPLGQCVTSVAKMMGMGTGGIPMVNREGTGVSSTLIVLECKISPIYTFLDSSNGNPKSKDSLHYTSPVSVNDPNPYEQAIQAVGVIMEDYDTDKLFPVYGFGARIPPHRQVSHNFYVTLSDNGYCYGIDGILETYRTCMSRIELYAPTNFSPVIRHVSEVAEKNPNGEHYFVLLIITDGVITDMPETKEALVRASGLPISIIIVGVGEEDFSEMEVLDGDAVRISFKGKKAERDIVQFVPYRDAHAWLSRSVGRGVRDRLRPDTPIKEDPDVPPDMQKKRKPKNDTVHKMAQERLAQEVLAEIPDQLTSFMKSRNLAPTNIDAAYVQRLGA